MVKEDFKQLNVITEGEDIPIVEYKGEYYWVGEDECPYESEEAELEIGVIPAFRKSIGVQPSNSEPYIVEYKEDVEFEYRDGIVNSDFGVLPNQYKKIYKIVDLPENDFIIRRYADHMYDKDVNICIKNGCKGCEFYDKCKPRLLEIDFQGQSNAQIVVFDISAQEPFIAASIAHKEPRWIETFRNRSIREAKLDVFLNVIMEEQFGIEPDNIRSYKYWEFLEYIFFDEQLLGKLVRLNNLSIKYQKDEIDKNEQRELERLIGFFIEEYEKYTSGKQK